MYRRFRKIGVPGGLERLGDRRYLSAASLDLFMTAPPIAASSNPQILAATSGHILVGGTNEQSETEIWISAGTPQGLASLGTVDVVDDVRTVGANFAFRTNDGQFLVDVASGTLRPWDGDGTAAEADLYSQYLATYDGLGLIVSDQRLVFEDIDTGQIASAINLATDIEIRAAWEDFVATPWGIFFSLHERWGPTEIWWTDGTEAGTQLIRERKETDSILTRPDQLTWFDGQLYYGDHFELRRFDPLANQHNTLRAFSETASAQPSNFLVAGGRLFFAADGGDGVELWSTDGTALGTMQVEDLHPGSQDALPGQLVELNGALLFVATHPDVGRELWTLNLASGELQLLADLRRGFEKTPSAYRDHGVWYEHRGVAYFSVDVEPYGEELWRTDGTPDGTYLLRDIATGDTSTQGDSFPGYLFGLGEWVYFFASDRTYRGFELWRTNGSDRTEFVKDIYHGGRRAVRAVLAW